MGSNVARGLISREITKESTPDLNLLNYLLVTKERGLKLRIAQNQPSPNNPNLDTQHFIKTVGAK